MTPYEWASTIAVVSGEVGAVFAWIWNENGKAKVRVENEKRALETKLDVMEREGKNSLYNAKKDVLDKLKEDRDALHERCEKLEQEHEAGRAEFTKELRNIADTFTRACDGFQVKLEHLTSTIIGQYVPRAEIDSRFSRIDEKQDRVLNILYELKK